MNELKFSEIIDSDYSEERKRQLIYKKYRSILNGELGQQILKYYHSGERDEFIEKMIDEIIELSHQVRSLKASIGNKLRKETTDKKEELDREIRKYQKMQRTIENYEEKEKTVKDLKERQKEIIDKEINWFRKEQDNIDKCRNYIDECEETILKALDEEHIRYSDNYDMKEENNLGYLIGLKKAKKIIKETYTQNNIYKILETEIRTLN